MIYVNVLNTIKIIFYNIFHRIILHKIENFRIHKNIVSILTLTL